MRRSDLVRQSTRGRELRTSQIIFGERQHLLRVLESLEKSSIPHGRMMQERRMIEQLIDDRTQELNRINSSWDEKIGTVLNAAADPGMLEKLSKSAPKEDYYLLRLVSEHPRANSSTLRHLAKHPYPAIRENIARHPNADSATLVALSRDRTQPLWYLVAFNPNTPSDLRRKLQDRRQKLGKTWGAQ